MKPILILLMASTLAFGAVTRAADPGAGTASPPAPAGAVKAAYDMSPYKDLAEAALGLVREGKMPEAFVKTREMEKLWDGKTRALRKDDEPLWTPLDKQMDRAMNAANLSRKGTPEKAVAELQKYIAMLDQASAAPAFDKGGTSFDFEKISAQRFGSGAAAATAGHPLKVILSPMALLDNVFCLSSHDPAIMVFTFRRQVSPDDYTKAGVSNLTLCVELPAQVEIKSVHGRTRLLGVDDATVAGVAFKRYRIDFSGFNTHPKRGGEKFMIYPLPAVLAYTDAAEGTALPDARYWMEDKGRPLTATEPFALRVLPQIKFGPKPELFLNGLDSVNGQNNFEFTGKESIDLVGRFVGNGCNLVVGQYDQALLAAMRTNGLRAALQDLSNFANGYKMAPEGEKGRPPEAKFVTYPAHKVTRAPNDVSNGICPVTVYTESAYYKNSIVPWLTKKLQGYDGLWSNWEPYMFDGQGCYCDRCRDEFIRFAHASEVETKKGWPENTFVGSAYRAKWIEFRAWQHAKMIATLGKTISAICGDRMGFLPAVAYCTVADSAFGRDFSKEWNPALWVGALKYVEPWGPYPEWSSQEPFTYAKALNLQTYATGLKVRDWTEKTCPDPARRPKLIAYPTAHQLDMQLVQPEALEMDEISFLLTGYAGAVAYSFPCGYDNRYWAELARLNRQAVLCEKYVFMGNRFPGFTAAVETPFPAPVAHIIKGYYADVSDVSVLQTAGFALGDKRLAAVGNFWSKGDAFIRLKAAGLDPARRYVVCEPEQKRYFAAEDNGDSWSAADLAAKGVMAHVGALRWALFVFEPSVAGGNYGQKILPAQVAAAAQARTPELARAADIEKARDARDELQKTVIRKVTSGPLACEPKSVAGDAVLSFTSGERTLNLDPESMVIRSWEVERHNLAMTIPGQRWGLGMAGFWSPGSVVASGFRVTRLEATPAGITVVGERDADPTMRDAAVTQQFEIERDLARVHVTTTVRNGATAATGMKDATLGFRYHNLPASNARDGAVLMKNGATNVVYQRTYQRAFFARSASASAPEAQSLYKAAQTQAIDASEARLTTPGGPALRMTLAPTDLFCGFGCWDDPATDEAASFEPCFDPVTIKPGQSAAFEMVLSVTSGKPEE